MFTKHSGIKDMLCPHCKTCRSKQQAARRASNPEAHKARMRVAYAKYQASGKRREHQMRSLYGITVAQAEALLVTQGGGCALCKEPLQFGSKKTHVDHCHATGAVRGVLCHHCNMMLGFAKDNPAVLKAAIEYLGGS